MLLQKLEKDQLKSQYVDHKIFINTFSGYNRVFGYYSKLDFNEVSVDLVNFLVSCYGYVTEKDCSFFLNNIYQTILNHKWKFNNEQNGITTYNLDNFRLIISKKSYRMGILVNIILSFMENDKELYNSLNDRIQTHFNKIEFSENPRQLLHNTIGLKNQQNKKITDLVVFLKHRKFIFYSGAGVSLSSGIPTFTGVGSLNENFELIAPFPGRLVDFMIKKPQDLALILGGFQLKFITAQPSPVHKVLSKLEKTSKLKFIITNNFDSLHQQAGTQKIYFSKCFSQVKEIVNSIVSNSDLFIISGVSRDEFNIIKFFRKKGIQIIIIDIEPPNYIHSNDWFIQLPIEQVMPNLVIWS